MWSGAAPANGWYTRGTTVSRSISPMRQHIVAGPGEPQGPGCRRGCAVQRHRRGAPHPPGGSSFVQLFAPAYPRSRRFRNDGSAPDCIMTRGSSAAGSSSGQRKSISPKAPSPAPIAYAIQINAKIATPSDFSTGRPQILHSQCVNPSPSFCEGTRRNGENERNAHRQNASTFDHFVVLLRFRPRRIKSLNQIRFRQNM